MRACPIEPLCAKALRRFIKGRMSLSSISANWLSVCLCHSSESPMGSTAISPRYCWQSARYMHSFLLWSVKVTSARMMLDVILYVLSSASRPDGMSMLATRHSDELIYLTREAKPPVRGLFSPDPKRPSITSVVSSSSGGSNSSTTSTNRFMCFELLRRCLLA